MDADNKEVKNQEEEEDDDPYSDSKEYSASSDSDEYSDSSVSEDQEASGPARCMFQIHNVVSLASTLKADSTFVELSVSILKYLRDGEEDVQSFSQMVNQALAHQLFIDELYKQCKTWYFQSHLMMRGHETQSHEEIGDKLCRIRNDPFLEEVMKGGGKVQFFKEAVEGGDLEIAVRGALSVLLSYCISGDYLRNMGVCRAESDSDDYSSTDTEEENIS